VRKEHGRVGYLTAGEKGTGEKVRRIMKKCLWAGLDERPDKGNEVPSGVQTVFKVVGRVETAEGVARVHEFPQKG